MNLAIPFQLLLFNYLLYKVHDSKGCRILSIKSDKGDDNSHFDERLHANTISYCDSPNAWVAIAVAPVNARKSNVLFLLPLDTQPHLCVPTNLVAFAL